jgi:hypothetical protein
LLASPSAYKIGKINFCLLDVSDMERIKRLKKRNTDHIDQKDPQWMQSVLKQDCWKGLDFSHWDNLTQRDSQADVTIIDTTQLSIYEVALSVNAWIDAKRAY